MNLPTDHSKAVLDGEHSHGAKVKPQSSRADRLLSFNMDDIPIPKGLEENWRFTPIKIIKDFFADKIDDTDIKFVCDNHDKNILIEKVDRTDKRLGSVKAPGERSSVVQWNNFTYANVITVEKDAHLVDPIVVKLKGENSKLGVQHIYVNAKENSKSTIIIEHTGKAYLSQGIEINVEDGADLTFVSTQEWDDDSIHLSDHRCKLGKDSTLKHIVITLGGKLVRITPEASFTSTGGNVQMLGVYFTDSHQHQEHRLFIDHSVPKCYSRVTYKGALQGDGAHSVWIGDVLIGAEADGTDTYELNRNLVLSQGAKADSVPNLEIENGEIEGAGHASATGRFEDEQLFYLCSRGIDEPTARRLVVRGFFAELINEIGVEQICDRLNNAIEIELERSGE